MTEPYNFEFFLEGHGCAQDIHHQAQTRKEGETESTDPTMGENADRQSYSLQCQTSTLASHQAETLGCRIILM